MFFSGHDLPGLKPQFIDDFAGGLRGDRFMQLLFEGFQDGVAATFPVTALEKDDEIVSSNVAAKVE